MSGLRHGNRHNNASVKNRMEYNYDKLNAGSIIGCTVNPSNSISNSKCDLDYGLALRVISSYNCHQVAHYDICGVRIANIEKSIKIRPWKDIYIILPWYKYYQHGKKQSAANIVNRSVLALWRKSDGTHSTIYYRARIIGLPHKDNNHTISVEFMDKKKTKLRLPVHINISQRNKIKLPTVIRIQGAMKTHQLHNALILKKTRNAFSDESETEPVFRPTRCIYQKWKEFICQPCGHYIFICSCLYCHDIEIQSKLDQSCPISSCHTQVRNIVPHKLYKCQKQAASNNKPITLNVSHIRNQ